MFEFKLPDLGEGVHEGEILHWHVKPGDSIVDDDPLVEVETDKAAVTIPSPRSGTVVSINGKVGETVSVGTVLVVIDAAQTPDRLTLDEKEADSEAVASPVAAPEPSSRRSAANDENEASVQKEGEVAQNTPNLPISAAPATRRLARELGVDLKAIRGSGAGGRVSVDDVRSYASAGQARSAHSSAKSQSLQGKTASIAQRATGSPGGQSFSQIPFFEVENMPDFAQWGSVEREQLRSIRRKIAHKMVTSMVVAPHVAQMDEADVSDLDNIRREYNLDLTHSSAEGAPGPRLTLLAFVIRAVVAQLKKMPNFNASIDPHREEIIYKKYYNVGFAADTPKGLVVPVIANADRLTAIELSETISQLANKSREGRIDLADLRGGSFTVTNVGSIGGTNAIPAINYPEVAILAMGRASDRPVVRNATITIRKILPLTLSFDHRIIDGADAARFLSAIVRRLSDPRRLLIES